MLTWFKYSLSVGLVTLVLAGVLLFTRTPYYVVMPGVTRDLNRVVQVQGIHYRPAGHLLMVAVTLARANLLDYLYANLTPYAELMSTRNMMPKSVTMKQYLRQAISQMRNSQKKAAVAALRATGNRQATEIGHGVQITSIYPKGPAAYRLHVGEVIVAVDGVSVSRAGQLLQTMHKLAKVGSVLRLTLAEANQRVRNISVPLFYNAKLSSFPIIGISVKTYKPSYVVPVPIHFNTGSIAGPSAGLMMSLEIISQISHQDLAHGQVVAGTGTMDASGLVGPIGGVAEKVITAYHSGAHIFLVPKANFATANAQVKKLGLPMKLYPVSTLQQALQVLGYSSAKKYKP